MMVMILIMKIIFPVPDNYVVMLSYRISIIVKLKNIVPIKDINSIIKINKKVCSQVYLEECNFINDSYDKNG